MKKIGVIGIPGRWSSEQMADAVEKKTGFRSLIDIKTICLDLETSTVQSNNGLFNQFDALIIKKISPCYTPLILDRLELLRFANKKGLAIFSRPDSIINIFNRITCTVSLQLHNIPIPPTVITEDISYALSAVERFQKAVFKPIYTSKARGMKIIEWGKTIKPDIESFKSAGNPIMYIQKFIKMPGRDLGIAFLNGDYLATYARVGHNDSWNTTIASGGKYESYVPSREIVDIAYRAQSIFDLDFTCVDMVESDYGPLVFEVSAFGGFRGLYESNGIDAADLYADYVIKKVNNESN